jgi:hypothetical protein
MGGRRAESDIREFYQRWSAMVFTFCRLYLGDDGFGEAATGQAFSAFLTLGLPLHKDRLPIGLLRSALESVRHFPIAVPEYALHSELCHVVLSFPADERAVFILHGRLGLHFRWIAAVAGVPRQRVQQLWVRSLVRLRRYLPDFQPRTLRETSTTLLRSFVAPATGWST